MTANVHRTAKLLNNMVAVGNGFVNLPENQGAKGGEWVG
jgi:hypothetical protein